MPRGRRPKAAPDGRRARGRPPAGASPALPSRPRVESRAGLLPRCPRPPVHQPGGASPRPPEQLATARRCRGPTVSASSIGPIGIRRRARPSSTASGDAPRRRLHRRHQVGGEQPVARTPAHSSPAAAACRSGARRGRGRDEAALGVAADDDLDQHHFARVKKCSRSAATARRARSRSPQGDARRVVARSAVGFASSRRGDRRASPRLSKVASAMTSARATPSPAAWESAGRTVAAAAQDP